MITVIIHTPGTVAMKTVGHLNKIEIRREGQLPAEVDLS